MEATRGIREEEEESDNVNVSKCVCVCYLYCNESCTIEEIFPTVGHFCSLTVRLRVLPPEEKRVNRKQLSRLICSNVCFPFVV